MKKNILLLFKKKKKLFFSIYIPIETMKNRIVVLLLLFCILHEASAFVSDEDDSCDNDAYMSDIWVSLGGTFILLIAIIATIRQYIMYRQKDAQSPLTMTVDTKISTFLSPLPSTSTSSSKKKKPEKQNNDLVFSGR